MKTHKFYLFRHGETDWNKKKKFQGHSDIPLNRTGEKQAQTLVSVFKDLEVSRIISSDLTRAKDTAQVLVDHYGFEIHLDKRLRETNMGDIEGKTLVEVTQKVGPDAMNTWRSHDPATFDFAFPNGETKNQVRKRVKEALIEWSEKHPDENLAISSHGGAVRLMLTLAEEIPDDFVYVKNCSVFGLEFNKKEDRWRSSFINLNPRMR